MRRLVTQLSDESGVVLAITGISALALLALVALVVDGGLLHNDRRSAQNAADNASMAAAWAICEGRDPIAAGLTTAAANGHDTATGSTVTVTDLGDGRVRVTIGTSRNA